MTDIVIPAGGVIDAAYAERIGTPYRALAPMGPGKTPVLQHIVRTLRAAVPDARVICVAPEIAAERVQDVDLWLPAGRSGPENIRLGLSRAAPNRPALLCTSDLPLMTAGSVQEFVTACRADAAISVGLVQADDYKKKFADAPLSEFVTLTKAGPVTLAGLFQIEPGLLERHALLFGSLFNARKTQWRMAGLVGPRLLWQLATRTLSLAAITRRAEYLIGGPVQVILGTDPALAYDIDTLHDYTYAQTRFRDEPAPPARLSQ